jgi:tetratricopeptide (TPR) repeat protein
MARKSALQKPEKSARPIPLFGRDRELTALDAAVDAAAGGLGSLVALTGEPGIGKTRLAEEVVARAVARGWSAAWGSGWPDGGSPPLWPWQHVLEQLGRADAAGVLDDQATTGRLDPERFARFRAVTAALGESAALRPVLIVLDDAQAADPAALVLARFAVRSLRAARFLLLVTCRNQRSDEDEVGAVLNDLLAEGLRLSLGGLDTDVLACFLSWAGKGADPQHVIDLFDKTGGNPLLVLEVIAAPKTASVVPDRIRRLLASHLAEFDNIGRSVLASAAVLGPAVGDDVVATVARVPSETVTNVRRQALAVGVLRAGGSRGFSFTHGLLRDALLDQIPPRPLADLHRRAAETLASLPSPATVERLARVAHHRVAAANQPDRGDQQAIALAVEASRTAARAVAKRFSYESAADLLRTACHLQEDSGERLRAPLLFELAQAELASGRLSAARVVFGRVIEVAEAEGDSVRYAEAAIGLGGIWVYEYRSSEEIAGFHATLRRALNGLGGGRPDLRARLTVRLAAEAVYGRAGTVDAVRRAVEEVRAVGDQHAFAEALSLLHHTMLGPEHAEERLHVARELVEVASRCGDAVLTLMGVLWRTVDLFLLGDPAAERSLGELRQRADALRVQAVLYIVEVIDVMLLIRAGRFIDAESAASRCYHLGTEVGDVDALAYFGAHLLAIRWMQGRVAETLPLARDVAASSTLVAEDDVYRAAIAALAAEEGELHLEEAARELDRLAARGIGRIPSSSNFLVTLFAVVEAAARLGDSSVAAAAYEALLPYRALPTMASIGVVCFGSTERTLGVAARSVGRLDDAVRHFERAIEVDRRLGNRPMLALARADLGLALLARGGGEDRARGAALVNESGEALGALGCDARTSRVRADADALLAPVPRIAILRWADGGWEVIGVGERAVVPDSLGIRYLARLLAAPRRDVEAADLAGVLISAFPQEILDAQAIAQYRRRIDELRSEVEAAEANVDLERVAVYRAQLDQLVEHVEDQLGLAGRSRRFADPSERARTAVQKAIRRAIHRIGMGAPKLAEGLAHSVRTGSVCRYEPVEGMPTTWVVTGPPP